MNNLPEQNKPKYPALNSFGLNKVEVDRLYPNKETKERGGMKLPAQRQHLHWFQGRKCSICGVVKW